MAAALGWGALAAGSLVLGALVTFARPWSREQVGLVLAFGAGALISAVCFELAQEGIRIGDAGTTGIGLGVGALTYYVLARLLSRRSSAAARGGGRSDGSDGGVALALGAFLDGIPEQLVLGIGLVAGEGVSVALLVAIFVSNLPEAIGSASDMSRTGRPRSAILKLWGAVAAICTLATVAGYLVADAASADLQATFDGFAAGALLVMLIDSMIPEARAKAGPVAGLITVLGFSLATGLSSLS